MKAKFPGGSTVTYTVDNIGTKRTQGDSRVGSFTVGAGDTGTYVGPIAGADGWHWTTVVGPVSITLYAPVHESMFTCDQQ